MTYEKTCSQLKKLAKGRKVYLVKKQFFQDATIIDEQWHGQIEGMGYHICKNGMEIIEMFKKDYHSGTIAE